jgi:IstB-like ATP binding protein
LLISAYDRRYFMTAMSTPLTDSRTRCPSPYGTQEIPVWSYRFGDPETLALVAKHATVTLPSERVIIPSTELSRHQTRSPAPDKRTSIQSPYANLILVGWSGIGKSHIIQAVGQKACVHGYHVLYRTSADLLADLTASLADKTLPLRLRRYARPDLLIIV